MILKKSILVIGAGGHAKSCINTIEQIGNYKVSGIIGLPSDVSKTLLNHKILNSEIDLIPLVKKVKNALIAVGQISTSNIRIELFDKLKNFGFNFPILISPFASVSPHAKIGSGTIVMPGAIINAGATIGNNCIINSHALIEHDVEISDHCHISTRATLNGNIFIGVNSFVGSGAIIKQGIHIGSNTIIGMGSVVKNEIASDTNYSGKI